MSDMETIAQIEGKTTPFGFDIRLYSPIKRNTYLAVGHEDKTYILGVNKLWNEKKGSFAKVGVIGEIPLTPFAVNSEMRLATDEEIIGALGLHQEGASSLQIGSILHSNIVANLNIEKMGRIFITGKSGSGKSYTVGVILEELIKKNVPLLIIDRHGEFSSLKILDKPNIPAEETFYTQENKQKYLEKIIEFGDPSLNPGVDLDISYLLASSVEDLVKPGTVIIINLRGIDLNRQEFVIERLCHKLYMASTSGTIPPHFIFIDEAHLFAGKKKKPVMETLQRVAQEGRKFGSNLVVITQKPQALDTTIRAQAGTWIIHKLTDVNDIKITVNSAEGLSADADDEIQNLAPGEAIITGDLAPYCPLYMKIRKRYTVHGGSGYNVLDHLDKKDLQTKSHLVDLILGKVSDHELQIAEDNVKTSTVPTLAKTLDQLDNLKKINLELEQKLHDLEPNATPAGDAEMDPKKLLKEIDNLNSEVITLELEMSGIKVEIQDWKDKYDKEQKRADDAVALAEILIKKLKKKK